MPCAGFQNLIPLHYIAYRHHTTVPVEVLNHQSKTKISQTSTHLCTYHCSTSCVPHAFLFFVPIVPTTSSPPVHPPPMHVGGSHELQPPGSACSAAWVGTPQDPSFRSGFSLASRWDMRDGDPTNLSIRFRLPWIRGRGLVCDQRNVQRLRRGRRWESFVGHHCVGVPVACGVVGGLRRSQSLQV